MTTRETATTSKFFSQSPQSSQDRSGKHKNASPECDFSPSRKRQRTLSPEQQPQTPTTSQYFTKPTDDEARKRKLEAKKKSLLSDNNPFLRRKNSDIVQVTKTPAVTENVVSSVPEAATQEEADNDSDGCSALKALFTSEPRKRKRAAKKQPKQDETYTAGELQAIELKKQYPGVILMFEIGYKCIFFGDDAEVASRELQVKHSTERKLASAMVPMNRREIYMKKLLSQGYKVGLVEQTETRALKKAGANRNTPFTRAVNKIYTAATYVDELGSLDDEVAHTLMTVVEGKRRGKGTNEKVAIAIIVVCPTSGEVVWDCFEDTGMRTELETRMVHARPQELLLPEGLSGETSKLLKYHVDHSKTELPIRIENFSETFSYSDAFSYISEFYAGKSQFGPADAMAIITDFPRIVIIALAHMIQYLSSLVVSRAFRQAAHFTEFKNKMHMILNANTLTNLEIYRNDTDLTKQGSLLWILDRTKTRFGGRKLRSWIGRPLLNTSALQERLDAVEEMNKDHEKEIVKKLSSLLIKLPDLEKGLSRIQYGSCTPQELCNILETFHRVANIFPQYDNIEDIDCRSKTLKDIVFTIPRIQQPIRTIVSRIKMGSAKVGEKHKMWETTSKYHNKIVDCAEAVELVELELLAELQNVREYIGDSTLEYITVGLDEYLIQLPNEQIKDGSIVIPDKWIFFSSTKNFRRYRPDQVANLVEDRSQCKELLEAEANIAFQSFLQDICTEHYSLLRDVVSKLAVADCLQSLAQVAKDLGYVRPTFTDDEVIDIKQGRHPVIEVLRSDPFIPNDICLGGGDEEGRGLCKIITGPNMGGKSSTTRMVAIIAVMAQIGSYVPAESLKMGMLDGIMTRMGASDELARGRSTFMVEMTETSEILHGATSKSLVILDELGRGTSTFDGMAIAKAVLQHIVQNVRCKTLFITHYPLVATELEKMFPLRVENLHMAYTEESRINGFRDITFLYKLTRGVTTESFGVECGRLAGLPEDILQIAAEKSGKLKAEVETRMKRNRLLQCVNLLKECVQSGNELALDELKDAVESLTMNAS